MAIADQPTRSSTHPSADSADRAPAWPTRDLDGRGRRRTDATEAPTTSAPDDLTSEAATQPLTPETATHSASEGAAQRAPATSRTSSFLADLTRAMRAAAEAERSDVLVRFRQDGEAFVESMRGEFAAAADTCRARCDTDVASIEAWCEAELERIRRETQQGIAQRRERLEADLTAQAARLDTGVALVGTTVQTFEGDMASFFGRLLAEEDPSTFAVMARQLPEAPAFASWPPEATTDSEAWTPPAQAQPRLDDLALAAAEAEAAAALEEEGFDATPATTPATAPTTAPTHVGAHSAPARMVVAAIGLVSVASVSSFKRALANAEGVHTVHVSSGPQGEFLFTLSCDPGVDLSGLVGALPGFEVELRGTSADSVTIVARDLETEG